MNINIDTSKKIISINQNITIKELISFLKLKAPTNWEDFTLVYENNNSYDIPGSIGIPKIESVPRPYPGAPDIVFKNKMNSNVKD